MLSQRDSNNLPVESPSELKTIEAAIHENNLAEAINKVTQAITTIDDDAQAVDFYDLRITAYLKICKLREALLDAKRIKKHHKRGFFRVGQVYDAQGNSAKAIKYYEKALACVKDDDERNTALEKVQVAKKHNSVYVDWVTSVPTEIMTNVFEYISTGNRIKCTTVCKAWQTKVVNTPQIWRLTESTLYSDTGLRSGPMLGLLPYAGQHIEKFVVHYNPNDFLPSIVQGHFPNLKSLMIRVPVDPDEFPPVDRDLYLSALRKASKTLVELDVSVTAERDLPTFTESIATCPNLVKFRYRTDGTWHPCQEPSDAVGAYKLSELELDTTSDEGIPLGDLEVILKQCPNLKKLRVMNCHYGYVLGVIDRCCPKLEELSYHMSEIQSLNDACKDHFPITIPNLPSTTGTLRRMHLMKDVAEEPIPWFGVAPMLKRASPTLQDLFCSFNYEDHEFKLAFGPNPYQLYMPNLYSFNCTIGDTLSQKYIASIIRNAPNLHAVHILNCWDYLDDQILEALATLRKLRWLELHENKRSKENYLLQLFAKHVQLGNASPLEYVALAGDFVTNKVLMTLAQIPTLRALELEYCNVVSPDALDQFIEQMKNQSNFREIHLANMKIVTNETLKGLATIPTLRHVRLLNCSKLNIKGLRALVDTSNSLMHLELNRSANSVYLRDYVGEKLLHFDHSFVVAESSFIMPTSFKIRSKYAK